MMRMIVVTVILIVLNMIMVKIKIMGKIDMKNKYREREINIYTYTYNIHKLYLQYSDTHLQSDRSEFHASSRIMTSNMLLIYFYHTSIHLIYF